MHKYTEYFKSNKGFDRFIEKLYKKYQSLSKFSGTIKLNNLSLEESISLSRLFGITYKENDSIVISIKKFIQIMNNSKYEDFDINVLIQDYKNIKLITNKEKQNNLKKQEDNYYKSIINDDSLGCNWLENTISKKNKTYKLIHQRYNKNKVELKKELINITTLINNLPKEKTLLSIFSSTLIGDPHYLDLDNNHSSLFFYALSYVDKSIYPTTRENKIKLLSKYNIEIDNLSNYVLTYNLLSDKEYINKFSENNESLILNIQNILTTNYFDTKSKKVFIFENPSILTEIIIKKINCSVIISSGFPNISVYLLIDKLIETGNVLYYNGDFDPEGLLIADKLQNKYKNKLKLFCYKKQDYENCISNNNIDKKRLNILEKIYNKDLLIIKKLLIDNKLSGYQENNKEKIINYINISK